MKREVFEAVMELSKRSESHYEIEKLMVALLRDTDADLEQLHEILYFFLKMFQCCDTNSHYYIRQVRTAFLENVYGKHYLFNE